MFQALCAHQEVKIVLYSIWYHHTYRCDDTRGCVIQFWPHDDEHMSSKHVEAWNKLIAKQKFCASSWLITEINILRCTVSKTSKFPVLFRLRTNIINVSKCFVWSISNSKEQRPKGSCSLEASSASQGIYWILWSPRVHYRFQKALYPSLSRTRWVQPKASLNFYGRFILILGLSSCLCYVFMKTGKCESYLGYMKCRKWINLSGNVTFLAAG